ASDRLDVLGEFRPALEPVPPRDDDLGIGKREFLVAKLVVPHMRQPRMMLPHERERMRVAGLRGFDELLRLLLVLIEIRSSGQFSGGHTNLLPYAPGVRPNSGKKEGSWPSRRLGGHGHFRGLEA